MVAVLPLKRASACLSLIPGHTTEQKKRNREERGERERGGRN